MNESFLFVFRGLRLVFALLLLQFAIFPERVVVLHLFVCIFFIWKHKAIYPNPVGRPVAAQKCRLERCASLLPPRRRRRLPPLLIAFNPASLSPPLRSPLCLCRLSCIIVIAPHYLLFFHPTTTTATTTAVALVRLLSISVSPKEPDVFLVWFIQRGWGEKGDLGRGGRGASGWEADVSSWVEMLEDGAFLHYPTPMNFHMRQAVASTLWA